MLHELPDPEQVKDNVQQVAMQPRGAENCPPSAQHKYRIGAACAENQHASVAWRKDGHPVHPYPARIHEESRGIQGRASPNHDGCKTQIAQAAEYRGKTPHSRILPAAVQTLRILNPYQLSTGWANRRSGSLSPEHLPIMACA